MYDELLANIAILVLAGFVGFAVISKVPNTLHTPLMSGTNAIHGIVVLGALIVLGDEAETRASLPCLDERFQRVEFSASVLLWGGEGVSLRPRVPGLARVSYVLLMQIPARP